MPLPQNTNVYIDGTDLQNSVLSYIKCNCQNTSAEYNPAEKKVFLNGSTVNNIERIGSDNYISISASTNTSIQANDTSIFFVELEAFISDTIIAPTPTQINVESIVQNRVTITYTRGE